MSERSRTIWSLLVLIVVLQTVRASVFWLLLRFAPPFADTITRFQVLNGASLSVAGLMLLIAARPSTRDLGLSLAGASVRTKWSAAAGVAVVIVLVATSALFEWQVFVLNAVFGLAVPALEEGVFRGWAYGRLERTMPGVWGPLVVTTAMFVVWHLGYVDVFAQHPMAASWGPLLLSKVAIGVVLGAGLGWLRMKSGRVYAPFVAHALWNIFAP